MSFEEVFCAQIARPSEITSLTFDAASNLLAACNRDGVVQVFVIESNLTLRNTLSIALANEIPKVISFGQMGRDKRDILIFGLHSGVMWVTA
jgi:hypothetical protein